MLQTDSFIGVRIIYCEAKEYHENYCFVIWAKFYTEWNAIQQYYILGKVECFWRRSLDSYHPFSNFEDNVCECHRVSQDRQSDSKNP